MTHRRTRRPVPRSLRLAGLVLGALVFVAAVVGLVLVVVEAR
jgi:hypothetical protein